MTRNRSATRRGWTSRQLALSPGVIRALEQAWPDSPHLELCGYLVEDARRNQYFVQVHNRSNVPNSFTIRTADVERVAAAAALRGHSVKAFIHSHLYSLDLSAGDQIDFSLSEIPWIIVSAHPKGLVHRAHFPPKQKRTTSARHLPT